MNKDPMGGAAARPTKRRGLGRAFLIGTAAIVAPALAHAHFILLAPDSWMSQDSSGLPEKLGPCGDEGGGTPTGKVTPFHPGQTITVTIDEVVPHPGHYRVALSVNARSELPAEPDVVPKGTDPCGSAAIQDPPTFPVLADNVLPHTLPFEGPQSFTVTLPTDVTCTKCTLQVLEFMSNHTAPCFYHHCADLSIGDAVSTTSTTSPAGPPSSSTTTTTRPCPTPRCSVEAVLRGRECASDTIPAAMRQRLDRAAALLEQAGVSFPGKARALRRRARRRLARAGRSAVRASDGKGAKLSAACAAAIRDTADRITAGLSEGPVPRGEEWPPGAKRG